MSRPILINGNFLCRNLTGIERFANEILLRLDKIAKPQEFFLLAPVNAKFFPEYKNIGLIISEKPLTSFPKWDLFYFGKFCKKNGYTALNFSNTAPLGRNCGFAFIHDIYAKDHPEDFTKFRDILIKFYCRLNYWNIVKNSKLILTVSNFTKHRIIERYNSNEAKIGVIPNGWEHFNSINENETIFEKFPVLKKNNYYFTLGSLQKRKNLKWILDYASSHPEEIFAISGKVIGGMNSTEIDNTANLKNVIMLGYVQDSEVKSLMKNCRAFLFPSYYEGFGIPPLEALSTGCKIIVSNSASLPEIYGKSALYIDPYDTNINLSDLMLHETTDSEEILKKYTYENAAEKLYSTLLTCGDNDE